MGPMIQLAETSWFSLLAASLSVVLAWQVWARVRRRLLYDLHKLPGPRPLPLIGNLNEIIGSEMYHKVRDAPCQLLSWSVLATPKCAVHRSSKPQAYDRQLHIKLYDSKLNIYCAGVAALDQAIWRHI